MVHLLSGKDLNPQIQELRGIAVLAVVIFHLNFFIGKNGFIGVDSFFVISGFLMATLYGDTLNWQKTKIFFKKRALRLLPAYWFTILFATFVAILTNLPHEIQIIEKHSKWALIFMPNVGFWMDAEYWGGSQFRPLLHLWSIGVEFQFYLIFPLICRWVNTNFKRIILTLSSFLIYILFHFISAKTAFFLMPPRLWQFMIGIILFHLIQDKKLSISRNQQTLMLILLILLMLNPFSLPANRIYLITTMASIVTCLCLIPIRDIDNKMSSSAKNFLKFVGKYSYSIYLVHFPLILFLSHKLFFGTITGLYTYMNWLIFFVSLPILVKIIFKYFESLNKSKITFNRILLSYLLVILIFSLSSTYDYLSYRRHFSKNEINISLATLDIPSYRCGKIFNLVHPLSITCSVGKIGLSKNYLLIGDSHADAIKNSLVDSLNSRGISLDLAVKKYPLSGISGDQIYSQILVNKYSKIIIHYSPNSSDLKALEKLLVRLKGISTQFVYLLPIPTYKSAVPELLYRAEQGLESFPYLTRKDVHTMYRSEEEKILLLGKNYGVKILDPTDVLCSELCEVEHKGKPIYLDGNHLTRLGANRLNSMFLKL